MDKIILSEQIHAYTYLGEPVPMVPRKSPKKTGVCLSCGKLTSIAVKGDKGTCPLCKVKIDVSGFETITQKETTTKDMKAYGLFPSVSRMCSYGEMDISLTNWYKNRLIKFTMDCFDQDRTVWMTNVQNGIKDLENEYSDRGSYIHGVIQKAMDGLLYSGPDKTLIRCVQEIKDWEESMGFERVLREKAYCDPKIGLGGIIDFECLDPRVIADYKTKHSEKAFEMIKKGSLSPLKSAIKQIAGYSAITGLKLDKAFVIPIRVDEHHKDTGETLFIELGKEDLEWGLKAIQANTHAWCVDNKYSPYEMYLKGECWNKEQIMKGTKNGHD